MSKRRASQPIPPGLVDMREAHRLMRNSIGLDVRKMIEKGFAKKIKMVERNKTEAVSVFEAILRQLISKADKGDRRALRLIGLYQDYAYRNSRNGQEIVRVFAPKNTAPENNE